MKMQKIKFKHRSWHLKRRQGVSLVIVAFGVTTLLAMAALVIDTGMVLNSQVELQKAVETSVLTAVTTLEPVKTGGIIKVDTTQTEQIARDVFKYVSNPLVDAPSITAVDINTASKAIHISAVGYSKTYFLKFLGIYTIKLNAQAASISAPRYINRSVDSNSLMIDYSGDTAVQQPLGDNKNPGIDTLYKPKPEYLYGPPDNKALSLGPDGYVTLRLPAPLVDLEGNDLYIREQGNLEGYFVFAGVDVNPLNPYTNELLPGDGIKWVNISCTGIPAGTNSSGNVGAYYVNVDISGKPTIQEAKFYGSGYFDLGANCSRGGVETYGPNTEKIASAKYLKIIDDNSEDGFMTDNQNVPTLIQGEHSSVTPGADIDAVAVLHHSRLTNSSDYFKDTDSDGLIDIVELLLGTYVDSPDSDGDGISDSLEYGGWWNNSGVKTSIIDAGSATVYFTNPTEADSDGSNKIIFK